MVTASRRDLEIHPEVRAAVKPQVDIKEGRSDRSDGKVHCEANSFSGDAVRKEGFATVMGYEQIPQNNLPRSAGGE